MTNMPGTNLVLVDSDGLIGLINPNDPNHSKCIAISNYLSANSLGTVVPYPIALEAATTLTRKFDRPDLGQLILESNAAIEEKPSLNEDVSLEVSTLFSQNTSTKNTPFDHYVCALAKKNNIKYIFSFDSFYKKQGLKLAQDLLKE